MMITDGLLSSGEVARALGISRQRLAQLRDGEGFPEPAGRAGPSYLWRWAEVERWLERRRGERPQVDPVLEHRLRQLERIGYRVWVGHEPDRHGGPNDLPAPGHRWVASISMRGWGGEGSKHTHDTPEAALAEALEAFYDRADRESGLADRDLEARRWELARHGWRWADDGATHHSTAARHHVFTLIPPGAQGEHIVGRAENLHEAKRQAIDAAEEVEFGNARFGGAS
jgi:hypothetical protein